ncbi:MAG: ABC transporter ATP-binding protein [bacterium]
MQKTNNNPLIYLCQKMWQYSEGNHKNVVLYVAMSIFANTLWSLDPLIIGIFLNAVQEQGVHSSNIWYLFLLLNLFLVSEVVFWFFHGISRFKEVSNAFIVRANYKKYLLEGTMSLPIEWHSDHHSGNTIDKIEKGTAALYQFSESTFQIIASLILLTTAFTALLIFDRLSGFLVIGISIIAFSVLVILDRKLVPGYKIVNRMENNVTAKIFDVLSNVTTVIILRVESLVVKSVEGFIEKPFPQFKKNTIINEWKWFSASAMGRLVVVLVITIYLFSHIGNGTILVGTIYILYGYSNQIRDTFFRFADMYNNVIRNRTSVANAEELSKDFIDNVFSEQKLLPKKWSLIQLKNLSFSYHLEKGSDLHLDEVALDIKKGERIALIGESGGGKSTFLKIARDLYHPKTLKFTLDGKKITGGFKSISDSISLVPQDPEIFATTIRENITLGVEYSDKYLKKFTDMACFTDIVKKLPNKLDSSIVEKGVNLSGGEKQRLALARGLLASEDKNIILLDEPTSSVDFYNELQIYKNIFTAFPDKTIISSIHRLHMLSLFDSIYFFKDGKIIASGSFEDLKNSSKDFQLLWEKYISTRDAISG